MSEPIWGSKTGPAFEGEDAGTTHNYEYRWRYSTFMAEWKQFRRDGWELVSGDPTKSLWRRRVGTGAPTR